MTGRTTDGAEFDMAETIKALLSPGRGLLAADESFSTMEARLKSIGVPSTEETRRTFREILFTTPGIGQFISGVILFDETIKQKAGDGTPFPEVLVQQGIIPGIKVDAGAEDLALFSGEKITTGLDGLRDRLAVYRELGARFTKFRSAIAIGPSQQDVRRRAIGKGIPTWFCIEANALVQAQFAALSQEAGLVPIVEPEVLMDGDHSIERCFEVTENTLRIVFDKLIEHRVRLEQMVLKPNMVLPGKSSPRQASVEEVAAATIECFRRAVPAAVPGIAFLSGGQDAVVATQHLNAINRIGKAPWVLAFSFSRALEEPVLHAWRGRPENAAQAQKVLYHRAWCNSAAQRGEYSPAMETQSAVGR